MATYRKLPCPLTLPPYDLDLGNFQSVLDHFRFTNHEDLTKTKLQLLLDDSYSSTKLISSYRGIFGTLSGRSPTKYDVIERVINKFIANGVQLADALPWEKDVTSPYQVGSNEYTELLQFEMIQEPTDNVTEVYPYVVRFKLYLENLTRQYACPASIRDDANAVLGFIEFKAQEETCCIYFKGSVDYKRLSPKLQGVCDKLLYIMRQKAGTSDGADLPAHLDDWLSSLGFVWNVRRHKKYELVYQTCEDIKQNKIAGIGENDYSWNLLMKVQCIRRSFKVWNLEDSTTRKDYSANTKMIDYDADVHRILVDNDFPFEREGQVRNRETYEEYVDRMIEDFLAFRNRNQCDEVPHPNVGGDKELYYFIKGTRADYKNGILKPDDYVIRMFNSINLRLDIIARVGGDKAENRLYDSLHAAQLEVGLMKESDVDKFRREVAIEEGPHPRKLDFLRTFVINNASIGGFVKIAMPGEGDEHRHSARRYTEEREQRKQHCAIRMLVLKGYKFIIYIRANIDSLVYFDKGKGKKIVDKYVSIMHDARNRAKNIDLDEVRVELHMINYPKDDPHVLENMKRIVSSPLDSRSSGEDDWEKGKTWDKMYLHFVDEAEAEDVGNDEF